MSIYQIVNNMVNVQLGNNTNNKTGNVMGELILNDNRYLGALCYRNHNHKDSGLSVRYKKKGRKKGGICVACNQEYHKAADEQSWMALTRTRVTSMGRPLSHGPLTLGIRQS